MRGYLLLCLAGIPAVVAAQSTESSGDVVREADDAFGRRIGIEDIGLYSESEVRGFNLQNAGNYRIEDHYYVRATGFPVAVSDGTLIRVGVNGLRTDFAAPSGVVQYDLPGARDDDGGTIEAGWWPGSGPTLVGRYTMSGGEGSSSVFVGGQFNPWQAYNDGTGGTYGAIGVVPRWRPTPNVRVSAIAMANWFKRGADTLLATDGTPPPRIRRNYDRTQDWMQSRTDNLVTGLFGEATLGEWELSGSAFLSQSKDLYGALNLLALPEAGTSAEATVVLSPREKYLSTSGELKAARSFQTGWLISRFYGAARWRRSISRTSPGAVAVVGEVEDLDAMPEFEQPAVLPPAAQGRDEVRQWTFGLGYRGSISGTAEVRVDAQKVRYAKSITSPGAADRQEVSKPWLFGGSVTVAATKELTLFGSYTRGLEESGVAPGNASNRGEVLPAALAKQVEVGARYSVPGGPVLIAGLFDITKPLPGLRSDGVYSYVGDVRHRGVELSLAGPITPNLNVVVGATLLEAKISGEMVDAGIIGDRPVGRPNAVGLASLTWQLPGWQGTAVDGGISIRGKRPANAENTTDLPAYAVLNLGLRHRIQLRSTAFTVRARVGNLLNTYAWTVNGSGMFTPNGPRSYTLTLTADL